MTPLDPTPSGSRGAQGGSRVARSSRNGTAGEHAAEPPLEAPKHRGTEAP